MRSTCEACHSPTHMDASLDIPLADPDFGRPGRIDLLLGVDIFIESLLHGRRIGPPGSPTAFETKFGWLDLKDLLRSLLIMHLSSLEMICYVSFGNLKKAQGIEEQAVVSHFKENHRRNKNGLFVLPLPKKPSSATLGESRSQAVRRFLSLERSLQAKNEFSTFNSVMQEYFDLGHAEPVPNADLEKPEQAVFYLPMHAVERIQHDD